MGALGSNWRAAMAAVRLLTVLPVGGHQPEGRRQGVLPLQADRFGEPSPPVGGNSDGPQQEGGQGDAYRQKGDTDWGRATAWYPAVGLLLGGILAGLDWGLRWLFPDAVATTLLLLAWVTLTGALHLDGLADCCDGLLAPVPRERRLEILRDVHTGAFGLAGVVLVLLVKVTALGAVPGGYRLPALLLVPAVARWVMTGAVHLYPYARSGPGLGQKAKRGAGRRELAVATATAGLVCGLAWPLGLGGTVLLVAGAMALAAFLVAQWIEARIGGLTGDGYGAICELTETAGLLAIVALAQVAHGGQLP